MRRKDREIIDKEEQRKILDECRVCRIALQDAEGLYLVPLNFGYFWEGEYPVLYVHSAREGRKAEAFKKGAKVCVELDCGHELKEAEEACGYGFRYRSLIGFGRICQVREPEEKKKGLSLLMRHQTGKEFAFTDSMTEAVEVFRVELSRMTGKACR